MTRHGPVLGSVLVLVLATASLATPAGAADEIGLSQDGVTWSSELAVPLFDSASRWVPGDDETHTIQLRNQGPSAASLALEALSPSGDTTLAASVAVSVRVDHGAWTPLGLSATARTLTVHPLDSNQTVLVDVRATFDRSATNPTQSLALPLVLQVTLTDAAASTIARGGPTTGLPAGDDRGGILPGTGTTVSPEALLAALALCALGATLIARRSSDVDAQDGVIS